MKAEQVADGLVGDLRTVGTLHVGQDDVALDQLGDFDQVLDAGAGLLDPPQRFARADDGRREEPIGSVGISDLRDGLLFILALDQPNGRSDGFQLRELVGLHRGDDHLELFRGPGARRVWWRRVRWSPPKRQGNAGGSWSMGSHVWCEGERSLGARVRSERPVLDRRSVVTSRSSRRS